MATGYTKHGFADGQVLTGMKLDEVEDGIVGAYEAVEAVAAEVNNMADAVRVSVEDTTIVITPVA